jgi:hypothetical protein
MYGNGISSKGMVHRVCGWYIVYVDCTSCMWMAHRVCGWYTIYTGTEIEEFQLSTEEINQEKN